MYNGNNAAGAVPTCDPAYGPDCGQNPRFVGIKEALLISRDNNEKMLALICQIRNGLFGIDPPEWKALECNCAQDVLNDCNRISCQSIEFLEDILRGINGD